MSSDDEESVCTEDLEAELKILEGERKALSQLDQLRRLVGSGKRSSLVFANRAKALKAQCARQQKAVDEAENADKTFAAFRVSQFRDKINRRSKLARERRTQRTDRRIRYIHKASKATLKLDLVAIANGDFDDIELHHSKVFFAQQTQQPRPVNTRRMNESSRTSQRSNDVPRSTLSHENASPVNTSREIEELLASEDAVPVVTSLSLHDVDNLDAGLSESDDELKDLQNNLSQNQNQTRKQPSQPSKEIFKHANAQKEASVGSSTSRIRQQQHRAESHDSRAKSSLNTQTIALKERGGHTEHHVDVNKDEHVANQQTNTSKITADIVGVREASTSGSVREQSGGKSRTPSAISGNVEEDRQQQSKHSVKPSWLLSSSHSTPLDSQNLGGTSTTSEDQLKTKGDQVPKTNDGQISQHGVSPTIEATNRSATSSKNLKDNSHTTEAERSKDPKPQDPTPLVSTGRTFGKGISFGSRKKKEDVAPGSTEEWGYNDEGDYVKIMVPPGSNFQQEIDKRRKPQKAPSIMAPRIPAADNIVPPGDSNVETLPPPSDPRNDFEPPPDPSATGSSSLYNMDHAAPPPPSTNASGFGGSARTHISKPKRNRDRLSPDATNDMVGNPPHSLPSSTTDSAAMQLRSIKPPTTGEDSLPNHDTNGLTATKGSRRGSRRSSYNSAGERPMPGADPNSDESELSSAASSPRAAGHNIAPQRYNFGAARTASTVPHQTTNSMNTQQHWESSKSLQHTVQPSHRGLHRKFSLRNLEDDGFDTDSTFGSTPAGSPAHAVKASSNVKRFESADTFDFGGTEDTSGSFDF